MPSYVEVLECLLTTVNVGNPVPPMENAASPDQQQPLVGRRGVAKRRQAWLDKAGWTASGSGGGAPEHRVLSSCAPLEMRVER